MSSNNDIRQVMNIEFDINKTNNSTLQLIENTQTLIL